MLLPPSRRHRCILIPHDNDLLQTVEEPAALICCLFVGELEIDKKNVNTCSLGIDRCDRPPSYDLLSDQSANVEASLGNRWKVCADIDDDALIYVIFIL